MPTRTFLFGFLCAIGLAGRFCPAQLPPGATTDTYNGRSMIVYVPHHLSPAGSRPLVIVLHGGLGNAQRIESAQSEAGLNMDSVADKGGFIVAYLNGTPVTRRFGDKALGWNAGGGCCGLAFEANINDVAYITQAADFLVGKYGIDRSRIYGIGHSNGAMMAQRLMCEASLFQAIVAISGPLNLNVATCPAARGKHILAIHGTLDKNVPVAGGQGTEGLSRSAYNSEETTRQVYLKSGAFYDLQLVSGAPHKLDEINASIQHSEGQTIAEKAARFFGLLSQVH
jgi:poly(3-hydroxybutyrate) depolymerase